MRVKVLEALAAGKATVGTTLAFEGMGIEPGRHALVADDAAAFTDAVALLLEDSTRRSELARDARAHVNAALSWDRTAARYQELYGKLLNGQPAARVPAP